MFGAWAAHGGPSFAHTFLTVALKPGGKGESMIWPGSRANNKSGGTRACPTYAYIGPAGPSHERCRADPTSGCGWPQSYHLLVHEGPTHGGQIKKGNHGSPWSGRLRATGSHFKKVGGATPTKENK